MPPAFRTARIVWGALLGALVAYLVTLLVVLRTPAEAPTAEVATMRAVFVVLAVVVFAMILIVRRRLPAAGSDPARTGTVDAGASFTTHLIGWVLAESIALYGLVLGLLARSFDEALPFFVASAALLLWQRPRDEHFAA